MAETPFEFPSSLEKLDIAGMTAIVQLYEAMFGRPVIHNWRNEGEMEHLLRCIREERADDFRLGSGWGMHCKLQVDIFHDDTLRWRVNTNLDPGERRGIQYDLSVELERRFKKVTHPSNVPSLAIPEPVRLEVRRPRVRGPFANQTRFLANLIERVTGCRLFLENELAQCQRMKVGHRRLLGGDYNYLDITRWRGGGVSLELTSRQPFEELTLPQKIGFVQLAEAFYEAVTLAKP